jgi:putative membrane protein
MKTILRVVGVLLCVTLAHAQDISMHEQDAHLLNKLHEANQLEIAAGQIAQTNTSSPGTKKFGGQLIKEHSAADTEVSALAKKMGVKLAAVSGDKLDSLRDLKGAKFDRAFAVMMTADHKAAIELVKAAQDDRHDPDVRALLDKTLPLLQKHLEHAEQLESPLPHSAG